VAGLGPAIHPLLLAMTKDVDARDKRGHDGVPWITRRPYLFFCFGGFGLGADGARFAGAAGLFCTAG
jgi:hypothetical protein